MKKRIMIITIILTFIVPLKVYALSTPSVEINVDGNVKNGEEVNIVVNMKGLEGLYAASVDFTYDKNDLNIISITAGDSIKKYEDEIMEIGGEVDTSNNKTSYSFTFLGDKKGILGDGTLVVIKAKILNVNKFNVGQDSIKVKLVKRSGDSVENYDYNFIGYNYDKEEIVSENEEKNDVDDGNDINNNEDENISIPNTENNTENITKEEGDSENIEDKVDENNTNKEENTFLDNILNGNIIENIINNIKDFISGNNTDIVNKEDNTKTDVDKEDNFEENETNNTAGKENNDKVNESISESDNNDSLDKNDEEDNLEDKEELNEEKESKNNIYIYFIGTMAIIAGVYGGYKLKNNKNK